jgi:hypothetical protein
LQNSSCALSDAQVQLDLDWILHPLQNPAPLSNSTMKSSASRPAVIMTPHLRQLDIAPLSGSVSWSARAGSLAWGFVALGTIIRLVVYLMRFPLWVDECMLAENYLDRGFLDCLNPLDHHQVAPIGFLWIELAIVKLLGFSEWSLRLFPLVCGIASLFVFRHVASRLLAGIPLVLAVGSLAVAKASIGLSADAKPYASDLFVAVALLALAVEWLRQPQRTVWLWLLVGAVPAALALSFPAVFVAGAVSCGLAVPVWRHRSWPTWAAFAAYNLTLGLAFLGLYLASTGAQSKMHQEFMIAYWSQFDAFPPTQLGKLAIWLVTVHLGDNIFSVPYGMENGGGLIALICLICGIGTMIRRGQSPVTTIFLATFGLAFVAAVGRHYPYGGHARLNQFLAPSLAIGCGLGAAVLLGYVADARLRRKLATGLVAVLALFGAGVGGRAVQHPFHHPYDVRQRDVARNVWRSGSEWIAVCALTDLHEKFWSDGWFPYYRCNQRIYSERHQHGRALELCDLSRFDRPVRLVVYRPPHKTIGRQVLADCQNGLTPDFDCVKHETLTLSAPDVEPELSDAYEIFVFEPHRTARGCEPVEMLTRDDLFADDRPL